MIWSMQDMKDYLQTMKNPSWDWKKNMTERITNNIAIDDAVEITREYRTYLAATTETTEEGTIPEDDETRVDTNTEQNEGNVTKGGNSTEVEEKKRKREGVEVEKEDESENRMNIDGDEKEETEEKEIVPRKKITPRRSKVVHEADEVMVTKVVSPVEYNLNPIPKGKGRVGSDDGVDEAGWKIQGGGDTDSVDTTNVSNARRTRIGLMMAAPPSGELDKQLCRVAQQWLKKMKESDSRFSLVPWKVVNAAKPLIQLEKNIPNLMNKMRMYFSRIQAKYDGGKVYTDVCVQHSVPIGDLRGDAE